MTNTKRWVCVLKHKYYCLEQGLTRCSMYIAELDVDIFRCKNWTRILCKWIPMELLYCILSFIRVDNVLNINIFVQSMFPTGDIQSRGAQDMSSRFKSFESASDSSKTSCSWLFSSIHLALHTNWSDKDAHKWCRCAGCTKLSLKLICSYCNKVSEPGEFWIWFNLSRSMKMLNFSSQFYSQVWSQWQVNVSKTKKYRVTLRIKHWIYRGA